MSEPNADNDFLNDHAQLLMTSFQRLMGKSLVADGCSQSLHEADYAIVSHGTEIDPIFNYANLAAQRLFEMSWQAFIVLPSRLSAEAMVVEERQVLLDKVSRYDFIDDYQGVRVSSSGRRFLIEDAVVWNLKDEQGVYHGQAAVLYRWRFLLDD